MTRAIESKEIETNYEQLFSRFIRDLKAIWRNVDLQRLPHPETFYVDLFSTAYSLVAKRSASNRDHNRNLLQENLVKFFTIVVDANEEKNQNKKYVG